MLGTTSHGGEIFRIKLNDYRQTKPLSEVVGCCNIDAVY
jgi:hypothetical protein